MDTVLPLVRGFRTQLEEKVYVVLVDRKLRAVLAEQKALANSGPGCWGPVLVVFGDAAPGGKIGVRRGWSGRHDWRCGERATPGELPGARGLAEPQ